MNRRKEPYVVKENPGTRAICACGRSDKLPYCDGSHFGTKKQPYMVQLETAQTVAWCACRKSGNRPFCDGTHQTLSQD